MNVLVYLLPVALGLGLTGLATTIGAGPKRQDEGGQGRALGYTRAAGGTDRRQGGPAGRGPPQTRTPPCPSDRPRHGIREDGMRLNGKVAIVTGAGQGFGQGIAETFAREGARVAAVDLNGAMAEAVAAGIGAVAIAVRADVSVAAQVDAAVAATVAAFGRVDIVVNNAGTSHRNRPMLEVDEEAFDRIFAVNVKSIYLFARATVPLMRAQGGGSILNIGSTAGIRPRPGLTWYNASKGAVNLMSKSMAVELAPDRIRVNALAPVAGETPLLATFMGEDTPEKRAAFKASIPWGRLSTAQDIANAAVFLSSDEAEMVTGTVLQVDGGRCI